MSEQRDTDPTAKALRALDHPHYGREAGISTHVGLIRDAAAEIERLRAALREIAEMDAGSPSWRAEDALNGR